MEPLANVRVLDLSQLIPGPLTTQNLSDLGADVVSIESPNGDTLRHLAGNGYAAVNRNKRSVALDLKSPEGLEACLRIADISDVVVEGFRPGVVERLGVGYTAIRERNPSVIYCSISGFGQSGPRSLHPGHDLSYVSASGMLTYSGHWAERPRRAGAPVADSAAASAATIAILGAIMNRQQTGEGCYIDIAIVDAAMGVASLRGGAGANFSGTSQPHLHPTNELFECADGRQIAIAAIEEHFWTALRDVVAPVDQRVLDPRFDSESGRHAAGDELVKILRDVVLSRPSEEWITLLSAAGVPADPVLTLEEATDSEYARNRGLVVNAGDETHVLFPALVHGVPFRPKPTHSPALGADTRTVLEEIGLDPTQIKKVVDRLGNSSQRIS